MENIENIYKDINLGGGCYIYPNGGCSEIVVNILKDIFPNLKYRFVDDALSETSLQNMKDEIMKSGDMLLVCGGNPQDELIENCKKNGLQKFIDGREYTAYLLAKEFEKEAVRNKDKWAVYDGGRVLHIKDNRWIEHYYYFYNLFSCFLEDEIIAYLNSFVIGYCEKIKGEIIEEHPNLDFFKVRDKILISYPNRLVDNIISKLISEKVNMVFWTSEKKRDYLLKEIPNEGLICSWFLIDFFNSYKILFILSGLFPRLNKNNNKIIVGIGHKVNEPNWLGLSNFKHKYQIRFIQRYFMGFDYYFSLSKDSTKAFEKIFTECSIKTTIVPAGSISLDQKARKMPIIKDRNQVEQFFFVPRSVDLKQVYEVIKMLLQNNKKVILRPHHAMRNYTDYSNNNPYKIFDSLKQYSNFIIDDGDSNVPDKRVELSEIILSKSIYVADNSSTSYSVPLSILRPCILFMPKQSNMDVNALNFGVSYAHPLLHRVAINVEEFMEVAMKLEKDLKDNGMEIANEIKQYKEKNFYNLGHSEEMIADFLKDLLEK